MTAPWPPSPPSGAIATSSAGRSRQYRNALGRLLDAIARTGGIPDRADPSHCGICRSITIAGHHQELTMGRPRTITADQEQRIADAYRAGSSLNTIAAAEGLSRSGIRYCLHRAGVQTRPPCQPKINNGRLQHLAEEYQAGASTHTIARAEGLAVMTVYNALRRAGVRMRDGRTSRYRGPAPIAQARRAEAAVAHYAFFAAHRAGGQA